MKINLNKITFKYDYIVIIFIGQFYLFIPLYSLHLFN